MDLTLGIILIVLALFVGALVTFALYKIIPALQAKNAAKKADKIIRDAEIKAEKIKKNAQIDGKQAVQEMRNEAEKDIRERKQEYYQLENKLNQREANIDKRDANLINKENALEEKNELLNRRLKECDKKENVLQTKIDSIISLHSKILINFCLVCSLHAAHIAEQYCLYPILKFTNRQKELQKP